MNPTPDSPADLKADTHPFDFEGRSYRLYKRRPGRDEHWYFRLQRDGQRVPRCLETNVAENAVTKAKAMIRAAKSERWDEFLEKTSLRKTCVATLGQVFALYRAYPNRKPAQTTRELNIHALKEILGQPSETEPLTSVNADAAWDWKQKILETAAAETGERHRQLLRSANSRMVQARSIFSKDLQAYYKRQGKLVLPKQIDEFLKEPKFPSDETGKTDYWPASDQIIARTFASLEKLLDPVDSPAIAEQNLNLYKAVWLALGFGLRKSEIAAAKVNWFQNLGGVLYCAGDVLGKNDRFPRVRAQLGAWEKLSPQIATLDPDAYILTGNDHERNDHTFRRCSLWMTGLGWSTQKMIHEFRSYAGCQVALGDRKSPINLRAAQEFLRHANITTTENYYMRYLRNQLAEVTLHLPAAQPFIPQIVTA